MVADDSKPCLSLALFEFLKEAIVQGWYWEKSMLVTVPSPVIIIELKGDTVTLETFRFYAYMAD